MIMNCTTIKRCVVTVLAISGLIGPAAQAAGSKSGYLSPTALAVTSDGKTLFVACATANQVAVFDVSSGKVRRMISVPESPQGLALSRDGARLFVTCAAPESKVCVVEVAKGKVATSIPGAQPG